MRQKSSIYVNHDYKNSSKYGYLISWFFVPVAMLAKIKFHKKGIVISCIEANEPKKQDVKHKITMRILLNYHDL